MVQAVSLTRLSRLTCGPNIELQAETKMTQCTSNEYNCHEIHNVVVKRLTEYNMLMVNLLGQCAQKYLNNWFVVFVVSGDISGGTSGDISGDISGGISGGISVGISGGISGVISGGISGGICTGAWCNLYKH